MLDRVERLRDGTRVHVRAIDAADRQRLADGFARLSPESRYRRFFASAPRLTDAMLDRLTANDGWNRLALGAVLPAADGSDGESLGVARFARLADEPDTAEVAIAVIDAHQQRGVGRLLFAALIDAARERGIARFRASVLRENAPARAMVEHLADQLTVRDEGDCLVYDFVLPGVTDAAPGGVLGRLLRAAASGVHVVFRVLGVGEPEAPAGTTGGDAA